MGDPAVIELRTKDLRRKPRAHHTRERGLSLLRFLLPQDSRTAATWDGWEFKLRAFVP
ncbi:uncharacterized protein G2W53_043276 [Senna tora]|uniref:Uncharacterized protein n=1 Tax=Senna tora TaxID=362788 RepID=A0A834SKS3_9FABA|nr:uncharacterized protein G2W53_043276 [Senna tora]